MDILQGVLCIRKVRQAAELQTDGGVNRLVQFTTCTWTFPHYILKTDENRIYNYQYYFTHGNLEILYKKTEVFYDLFSILCITISSTANVKN